MPQDPETPNNLPTKVVIKNGETYLKLVNNEVTWTKDIGECTQFDSEESAKEVMKPLPLTASILKLNAREFFDLLTN